MLDDPWKLNISLNIAISLEMFYDIHQRNRSPWKSHDQLWERRLQMASPIYNYFTIQRDVFE